MVLAEVLPYIEFVILGEDFLSPLNWDAFVETFKETSKVICGSQFVLQAISVPRGRLSGKSIHYLKTAYPDLEIRFVPAAR